MYVFICFLFLFFSTLRANQNQTMIKGEIGMFFIRENMVTKKACCCVYFVVVVCVCVFVFVLFCFVFLFFCLFVCF